MAKKNKEELKKFKRYYPDIFNTMIFVVKSAKDEYTRWLRKLGIINFMFISDILKKYKNKINFGAKI